MAAYSDPDGGPYPYVLYGSVSNQGAKTISQPRVIVDWSVDGTSIHQATAQVLDPQGQPLASLDPGATADLIVVVDDETLATPLADAQPSFGLAQ
jgi:archaellum component FlaG (FlaF/FlaG flagellin family)